jgi:hypothetical protein
MAKLEGVTELRGKVVVLEGIENPVLKRALERKLKCNQNSVNYDDGYHRDDHREWYDYHEYRDGWN